MEQHSKCERVVTSFTLGCVPFALIGLILSGVIIFIVSSFGADEYNEYISSVKIFEVNITRVTFTSSALPVTSNTLMMNVDFPKITDSSIPPEMRFECVRATIGLAINQCVTVVNSQGQVIDSIYNAVIDSGICSIQNGCPESTLEMDKLARRFYTFYRCNDVKPFTTLSKLAGNIKEQCNGFYPILTEKEVIDKWLNVGVLVIIIVLPILYIGFVIATFITLTKCPQRLTPEPSINERLRDLERSMRETRRHFQQIQIPQLQQEPEQEWIRDHIRQLIGRPLPTPPSPVGANPPRERAILPTENATCPITLEPLGKLYVQCNSCNNNFNADEAYRWTHIYSTCPLCRNQLSLQMAHSSTFIQPSFVESSV